VFWVYAVLCALLALAYWLLIMAWLYQAAAKASMNRTLWTILGLFFNLVAVIAFLIVRSLQAVCPSCGVYQKAAEYCRVCGAPMKCKCAGVAHWSTSKTAIAPTAGRALKNENAEETK
jgi:glutaminase